jgi:hypothetical protein
MTFSLARCEVLEPVKITHEHKQGFVLADVEGVLEDDVSPDLMNRLRTAAEEIAVDNCDEHPDNDYPCVHKIWESGIATKEEVIRCVNLNNNLRDPPEYRSLHTLTRILDKLEGDTPPVKPAKAVREELSEARIMIRRFDLKGREGSYSIYCHTSHWDPIQRKMIEGTFLGRKPRV